jgi:metallo-beta-lactamase class B
MAKAIYRLSSSLLVAACVTTLAWAGAAGGQTAPPGGPSAPGAPRPGPPPPPVNTPASLADLAAAKAAAGEMWGTEYASLCEGVRSPPDTAMFTAPTIEPRWIFDNVALIGERGTLMVVLKTSAGIIIIDAGYATKEESLTVASLGKLGIAPTSVKYILITHGHPDHDGGARYFQTRYGTRIVASAADWLTMHQPPPGLPANPQPWMTPEAPNNDVVVGEGDRITLGDEEIQAFLIPGHTPGALGFVFPVKDHGRAHMAGMFGGMMLGEGRLPTEALRQYIGSVAHFAQVTHTRGVDVELENHPIFDNTFDKLAALAARAPNAPNPFVIGDAQYQRFLTTMSNCVKSWLDRRAA